MSIVIITGNTLKQRGDNYLAFNAPFSLFVGTTNSSLRGDAEDRPGKIILHVIDIANSFTLTDADESAVKCNSISTSSHGALSPPQVHLITLAGTLVSKLVGTQNLLHRITNANVHAASKLKSVIILLTC